MLNVAFSFVGNNQKVTENCLSAGKGQGFFPFKTDFIIGD